MPRKPHIRPRVFVKSLDRGAPDALRMTLFNPWPGDPKKPSRHVEIEVIGKEDGSMELRMWNLGDYPHGKPVRVLTQNATTIVAEIPPSP